ncbi:MAG TPA: GNAT family N-acetyltransferase, partial [Mycobacteriales bacterium]|nr:GNAT family N-acetyltransferase [Mycobacteriales bacterium]
DDPDRPAPGVEWAGPEELAALLAAADPAEAGESGLAGLPRAAVIRSGGSVVAAAGYDRWPARTAHLCVLTDPAHRGRGHATRVAAVATAAALADGLLPQWRARVPASLRVADKLGYRILGRQRSLRLT